jgi:small-conductance mechanosensitive channel/CRP-like cAMP-binding protein
MQDVILVVFTVILALVLRAEPLRRLRTLTLPLLLTAVAALAHLVVNSLGVDEALTRWTQVFLVLALGFLVARGSLILVFDWVLVRRMGVTPPRLMREVVALLAYLALTAIILRSMDVEVGGLITTSAVITVVVGLALQQTLGNLLSGLALAWEQRITIGTWVEMNDQVGIIEQTGWRSLVARTRRGERILIPNSDVAAARVTILGSGDHPVAVAIRLGVAYGAPPDAVKEVLLRVANDIPGVLSNPSPKILTHDFADSAVVYECRLWSMTPWCRDDLTDEFLTRAHAALTRERMEIPFPQRTLHRARPQQTSDTVVRRQSALAASQVFGEIPEEATLTLAENSRLRRYAPGEAVLRAGEESTAMYLVVEGEAVVEQNGREFARVAVGDVFGEMAFFTGDRRTATVRASGSPLEVIEVDDASMRSLLEGHGGLTDHLAEKMAARRLQGEELRDETGALISPAGLVAQFRKHLARIMGR